MKSFSKKGYLVTKKLVDKSKVNLIKRSIRLLLAKHLKNSKDNNIDKQLLYLRKNNKEKFGLLFDSLQTLAVNYEILSDTKILKKVATLLNVDVSSITLTDVALRLDPPKDDRNSLGWHQDSSYFRQNDNGSNGVVLWTPIVLISPNMGKLEFLKDSHNLGPLNTRKKTQRIKNISSKRDIDLNKLKKFTKILKYDLNVGDSLLMNMDMVHRSGANLSKKFRISLIGRYHNMISRDFNSGLNIYRYSNKKLQKEVHG